MKKIYVILFLSIICGLLTVNYVYAGWPFNRTAAIEGVVTDATTGKPLENVVVGCEWVKAHHSLGGDIRKGFSYEVSVTDKEGKYRIPGKTSFHIFSKFSNRDVSFSHPLYETKWFGASQNKDEKGDYIAVYEPEPEKGTYGRNIYEKDGIIHFDLKLLSLEEKYVRGVKEVRWSESVLNKDWANVSEGEKHRVYEVVSSFESVLEMEKGAGYWKFLNKKNINYNLEDTFERWERIAEIFRKYLKTDTLYRKVKETENQIRKELKLNE